MAFFSVYFGDGRRNKITKSDDRASAQCSSRVMNLRVEATIMRRKKTKAVSSLVVVMITSLQEDAETKSSGAEDPASELDTSSNLDTDTARHISESSVYITYCGQYAKAH